MFPAVLSCRKQYSKETGTAVASRTVFINAGGRQPAAGSGPSTLWSACLCYSVSCFKERPRETQGSFLIDK